MRRGWIVLVSSVLVLLASGPAHADGWPGYLAGRLKQDPVYVTDHDLGLLPPGTAAQIKTIVARLQVPVYAAVTLPLQLDGTDRDPDTLISLLHDRLGTNGIYIVTAPSGSGSVQQFGGSLPVADAWTAADFELPYTGRTAPQMIQRFVDILLSGQTAQRLKAAEQKSEKSAKAIERHSGGGPSTPLLLGAGLSGLPLLGLLVRRRVRR